MIISILVYINITNNSQVIGFVILYKYTLYFNMYKLHYVKLIEIQFITYLVKYGTYESHLSSHDHLDEVYSQ